MCDLNRLLSDPPLQQETGIITLHMFYEGGVCVCVRECVRERKSLVCLKSFTTDVLLFLPMRTGHIDQTFSLYFLLIYYYFLA